MKVPIALVTSALLIWSINPSCHKEEHCSLKPSLWNSKPFFNLETVKSLLAQGACVDEPSPQSGRTPLLYLCATNNQPDLNLEELALLQVLLEHGADPNSVDNYSNNQGWTALHYSAKYGNTILACLLTMFKADVNYRNKNGDTPLAIAANRKGNKHIMSNLIEAGANINQLNNNNRSLLHEFIIEQFGDTKHPHRNYDYINDFSRSPYGKADWSIPDSEGNTPLHFLIEKGIPSDIEWALSHGAAKALLTRNKKGLIPIRLFASIFGYTLQMHSFFLMFYNNWKQIKNFDQDAGRTLFHHVAHLQDRRLVKNFFIGAKHEKDYFPVLNQKDKILEETALHLSAYHGTHEIAAFLVESGADKKCINIFGETAYDMATRLYPQNSTLIELLKPEEPKKSIPHKKTKGKNGH